MKSLEVLVGQVTLQVQAWQIAEVGSFGVAPVGSEVGRQTAQKLGFRSTPGPSPDLAEGC